MRLWLWCVCALAVALAATLGAIGRPARLARWLERTGRPEAALWAQRWDTLGAPDDARSWLRLALGYEGLGRREAMLRTLARAERAAVGDGGMLLEVGTRYLRAREYETACRVLEAAVEAPGTHRGIALNNLGFAWAKRGEHARALALYDEAAGVLGPEDAFPRGNRAIALAHLGRTDEAARAVETLKTDFARDPAAWYKAGVARAVMADREGAIEDLERALALGLRQRWWLGREEDLNGLRDDPRFEALARRGRRSRP